jgi:hypothetical protein
VANVSPARWLGQGRRYEDCRKVRDFPHELRPLPRGDRGRFTVVGAYPAGQEDYDLLREADDAARERIRAVAVPGQDPVGGDGIGRWS